MAEEDDGFIPDEVSDGFIADEDDGFVADEPSQPLLGQTESRPSLPTRFFRSPALPILGGMAGEALSLAPAAVGTLGAGPQAGLAIRSAGSGLGEAAGEAFRQLGQRALGDPRAPQTSTEAAIGIGQSFGVGAAAPGLTKGFLRGVSKGRRFLGESVLPKVTPAAREVAETIKRFGGQMSFARLTDSSVAKLVENVAEAGITSAAFMQRFLDANKVAADKMLRFTFDKMGRKFGKTISFEDIGKTLRQVRHSGEEAHERISTQLYNKVDEFLDFAPVRMESVVKTAQEELASQKFNLANRETASLANEIVGKFGKFTTRTFSDAHVLRSQMLRRLRDLKESLITEAGSSEKIRFYSKMVKSLDQAMERGADAISIEGKNLWRGADKFFKEGKKTFEDEFVTKLLGGNTKEAAQIGKGFLEAGRGETIDATLRMVKRASELDPSIKLVSVMRRIKSGFLDGLKERFTDASTGDIKFTGLLNALKPNQAIGESAKRLFKTDELANFQKILRAMEAISKPVAGGEGAAGLAQVGAGVGILTSGAGIAAGAITGEFSPGKLATIGTGIFILMSPSIMARIVTKPSNVKAAIEGIKDLPIIGMTSKFFSLIGRASIEAAELEKEDENERRASRSSYPLSLRI